MQQLHRCNHNKSETASSAKLTATNNVKQETVQLNRSYTSNHDGQDHLSNPNHEEQDSHW